MTQEILDGIKAARDIIDSAYADYMEVKGRWQPDLDRWLTACDHKDPDGSSAVETGFVYDTCLICNRSV
jgi:hypothetical protein